jgi:hypothetical protein
VDVTRPRGSRARSAAVTIFAALVAGEARADGPTDTKGAPAAPAAVKSSPPADPASNDSPADWVLRRRHTIAELELGFIALPNAPISPSQRGGNFPAITIGHGDATASLGLHLLFRGGADWAFGAGALFAPKPTADTTVVNGITRTHARDYLWMGGEGRYIPLHLKTVEAWVGIAVGGVVVADRFTTSTTIQVPTDLGTPQVTVRTEGFALGIQAGGEWALTESVILGLAVRFDNWILPANQACTPTNDCATLTGPVTEIEFGLRLGYRISL